MYGLARIRTTQKECSSINSSLSVTFEISTHCIILSVQQAHNKFEVLSLIKPEVRGRLLLVEVLEAVKPVNRSHLSVMHPHRVILR